jgi:hypothetical protein
MVNKTMAVHSDLVKKVVDRLPFNVPQAVQDATRWADRLPDALLQELADGVETSPAQLVKIYREMRRSELNALKDPEIVAAKQRVAQAQVERIWSKFFTLDHPEIPDGLSIRQALADRSLSLSDGTTAWYQHLDEAARLLLSEGFIKPQEVKQPLTADNLKNDEATLRKYCRDNRLQFNTAALNRLRELYGGNFKVVVKGTQDRIALAIHQGFIQLGPADADTVAQWDAEDQAAATQARNEWLTDDTVDLTERKAAAARILADHRNQAVKAQEQRELQSAKLRDESGRSDGSAYPPLPEQITKQAIFAADGPTLRRWITEFGNYAITLRVKGIQ